MVKPAKKSRSAPREKPAAKNAEPSSPSAPAASPALIDRVPAAGLAAVTALAVATPFVPSEGVIEQGVHVVLVAFWFVLLLGWILLGLVQGSLEIRWHGTLVAVGALMLWIVVAGLLRFYDGHPRFTLNMLWHWVSVALMFFLLTQFVRHPAEARALTVATFVLAFVLASFGVYQYAYSLPKTRADFAANPDQALAAAGIHAPEGSPERKHYLDRLHSTEPFATFSLTNSLAGFLAPWLVVGFCIALSLWQARGKFGSARFAVVVGLLVLGYCLILTKSRAGVLASLVGIALGFLYARAGARQPGWKVPLVGAAALALLCLAALVASSLDSKLLSEAPKSVLVRLEYWRSTAGMIADYPLLGCGPGNFQDFYTRYKLPQASETIKDPHNFVLETWSNSGTPALLLLGGVFVAFAYDLRRAPPPAKSEATTGNAHAVGWGVLIGALLGPCVALLSAYGFDLTDLLFLFLVAWPLAALGGWCFRNWVREGTLSTSAAVVAIFALLLNLLAAGSLAYPGVGLSLWILLAVALTNERAFLPVYQTPAPQLFGIWAGAAALAICFFFTAYWPSIKAAEHRDDGASALAGYRMYTGTNQTEMAQRYLEHALNAFEDARRADRYNGETLLDLATAEHAYWLATEKPEGEARFEGAAAKARRLRPHAAQVEAQIGEQYFSAYRAFGKRRYLEAARTALEQAIELYPNSNQYHAQLAWICFLAGDRKAAQLEAEEALRLDALLPHEELKLKNRNITDAGPRAKLAATQPPAPRETNLEQLAERLRNAQAGP